MAANLSPLDAGAAAASHSGRRDALQCGLGSNAAEVRRSGIASILAHGHPRRLSAGRVSPLEWWGLGEGVS